MANKKDFAVGEVLTAPSPATTGTTVVLKAGQAADMPAAPFNAMAIPPVSTPTGHNSEKIKVTAVNTTTDTLTIVRAQGGTTAQSISTGWIIANAIFVDDVIPVVLETPAGAVNGTNALFTCANGYTSGTLEIFVNGIRQSKVYFTETSPSAGTFTLGDAPSTGDVIDVNYLKA